MSELLLEVQDLCVSFKSGRGALAALDKVSFSIHKGETVALVGESGCGKSVTALSLAGLLPDPPAVVDSGRVLFEGRDLLSLSESDLLKVRGARIAYIFQEPASSLNPVVRVGDQIKEAIRLHRPGADATAETLDLVAKVGISEPERRLRAYPHELSGGMQQRIMIAIALACRPVLLVADEPTTALDVTIQAQILDLLKSLQAETGMSVLLITHNLGLVADVAHRVNVMYAGRIVEAGETVDVLSEPKHPYTRGLLRAVPQLEGVSERLKGIDGNVPSLGEMPEGCRFHPRCEKSDSLCSESQPVRRLVNEEHSVQCHYWK